MIKEKAIENILCIKNKSLYKGCKVTNCTLFICDKITINYLKIKNPYIILTKFKFAHHLKNTKNVAYQFINLKNLLHKCY